MNDETTNEIVDTESTAETLQEVNHDAQSLESQIDRVTDEGEQEGEGSEDKREPWFKRRIDELTHEKHEARRHAERLERMLEQQQALLQQFKPPAQEPQGPSLEPPNPADFAGGIYDPRYIEARFEHGQRVAEERAAQRVKAEFEQQQTARAQAEQAARLEVAEAAARQKYADYDAVIDVIASDPRLARSPVIQSLARAGAGPDLVYMLGKNPDVAYEVSMMSNPIEAGMKIAELINRAPRQVKNAPTPIRPLAGAIGNSAGRKSYSEMSTAEYIAARNAEELAQRKARIR